jgi:predicted kinase
VAEVVLLIGLQACGKTTFFQAHLAATHVLVSKDAMPRSARRKEARLIRELAAALAAGRDVCVDNTQPSAAERAGVIATARAAGARVVGHWWRPDLPLSLDRNARRAEPVPLVGLYAASARWEEPRLDEGFDELVEHP